MLNKDLGLTIVLAEHRLERVVQHVDRIIYLPPVAGHAPLVDGDPRAVLSTIPLVPPLAAVARLLGWQPVPLTIKEARRFLSPEWVAEHLWFILEPVLRSDEQKGFVVLPKRWIVERTFGWLTRCRRLTMDYEMLPASSEALIYLAMTRLMIRRLAKA